MQMLCLCVTELIFKCVNVIFKFAKKFYAQCLSKKFISAREKVYIGHCADFGLNNKKSSKPSQDIRFNILLRFTMDVYS